MSVIVDVIFTPSFSRCCCSIVEITKIIWPKNMFWCPTNLKVNSKSKTMEILIYGGLTYKFTRHIIEIGFIRHKISKFISNRLIYFKILEFITDLLDINWKFRELAETKLKT